MGRGPTSIIVSDVTRAHVSAERLIDMAKTVRELQRVLGQAAKDEVRDEVSRKFHSLYDKVCRKDVIWSAWLAVKANDGSGGVDGKELRDYEDPIERTKLLREIHRELLEGTYRAQPVDASIWRSQMAARDRWVFPRSRTASYRRQSSSL
jgi:hypothetical protein